MKYRGVDYYPEQWGIDFVEEDLKNIKEMYCETDMVDQDFVIHLKSSIATFRKLLWIYEL